MHVESLELVEERLNVLLVVYGFSVLVVLLYGLSDVEMVGFMVFSSGLLVRLALDG